ncbi:MAG: PEP-CTERM sorting domain-containing protein [Candidatus Eisenbacteria bacterium]|uniref:PEP-CTERM sorting domain-containing protein n=1 Tax=Eiseniibacteriota bacterium TaxID=2212470 RepID=A0A7Y2H399_UNCEI|nr:PEP-CTERM sorting domain-containing protein [Candidatus Eisenbacteria bacterium]
MRTTINRETRIMNTTKALVGLISGLLLAAGTNASAAVIEVGDLNVIDDPGNPSDGLRYLDMTFSLGGPPLADAIANAQVAYPNARVATPAEWDDLFEAAGIITSTLASETFSPGPRVFLAREAIGPQPAIGTYDGGVLSTQLGFNFGDTTNIYTDPDGSVDEATTRDFIQFSPRLVQHMQSDRVPGGPATGFGWLLVSAPPIPEPSHALLSLVGLAALGLRRRRN